MQSSMIFQMYQALLRELVLHKSLIVIGFVVVSFSVLGVGWFWPKSFEARATLYADEQNIIKPLLEQQAAVTTVDRAQEAKDLLKTRKITELIAKQSGLITGKEPPQVVDATIRMLQDRIGFEGFSSGGGVGTGTTFIRLFYTSPSADLSFRVVNAAVDTFIKETTEAKQRESRNAYQFINGQVATYKQQLTDAEQRLKEFNAENQDGSELTVSNSISQLQTEIQQLKLDIDDARIRQASVDMQLRNESQYLNRRFKSDVYRERLNEAQARLEGLLLTYTPTHPDVVSLKYQIEDLKRAMSDSQSSRSASGGVDSNINPLYEELRRTQSEIMLELGSKEKRLLATQRLLEQEFERSKRLAARQAELSDLTRDYDVTKRMYESLLESKEKARISMTLDVEGQGVTYKIQEAPIYPNVPKGLRFMHFALAGPILGVLVPLAALIAFIQLDPRIRYPSVLEQSLSVPVLAVVPHVNTPFAKRMLRSDMVLLSIFMFLSMVIYVAICVSRYVGWLG